MMAKAESHLVKTPLEIPYSLCEPETAQQHREKTLTPEFCLGSRMLNTNMGEGEREGEKGGDRGREREKKRERENMVFPVFFNNKSIHKG